MNRISYLIQKANQSEKVRMFDTYSASIVKFYNGSVHTVELTEAEYSELRDWFNRGDWQITPNITSGGFTAKKPAEVNLAGMGQRSIESMLGY